MQKFTMLPFIVAIVTEGCGGSVERLKHPKTIIVEAEKCAKNHGLRFAVSARDILVELSDTEKKIGTYDEACKDQDDSTIRRTFMCYLNECEKLPANTSPELFFTKIKEPCDTQIAALTTISSNRCIEWIDKLQKAISGK